MTKEEERFERAGLFVFIGFFVFFGICALILHFDEITAGFLK